MFEVAAADPGRVALVDGAVSVSFGDLAEHSRRIAAMLSARGVRPGDAVAVCAARGAGLVAGLYGVLAAGAAYVPVAVDQPVQRRTAILDQAGVTAVLTDDPARFAGGALQVPVVAIADVRRYAPAPVHRGSGCDLAYVIFTSGSTGVPKGVEIEHRQVVNTLADLRDRYGLGVGDRVLAVAAADFDLSVFDLFGVLGAGGSAVIVSDEDRRDPERWLALVREHGVTVWNTVPAMLDMLLTVAESGPGLPASLRCALVSGDWVGLDLPGRLAAMSSRCRLIALGGATEASIWSNCFEVESVDPGWVSIPYGRPLRNQRFRVVDEQGDDRPDWVPGELLIGGAGVARGYRGRPDLTAASFFDEGGVRWYRTGDVGRYRGDGVLEFLGRVDRQVKVRGHRVELGEVEQAIAAHPGVRRAFAVAVGERAQARLVAFVEPELPEDLPHFLADRIPGGWAPELIALPAPPLTGNGKIDHAALVRRAEAVMAAPGTMPGEPVRPGRETRIARIWQDILGGGLPDRHANFFAMGGDSLSATRLVGRLARELGITVTLRAFFLDPTIAGLGRHADTDTAVEPLRRAARTPAVTADPDHRLDPFPLTDIQVAYWLGRSADFDLGGIGAQLYVEYDWPDLDVPRLEGAWNTVLARHAMLRAVVGADGRQRVLPATQGHRIPIVAANDDFEGVAAAVRAEMASGALDAAAGPLFDLRVVRAADRARVCVVFDSLIVDGLSALVLLSEWMRLYEDPALELAPVSLEFRDYVLGCAPSEAEVAAALSYWRGRLGELPPGPQLPLRVLPAAVRRPRFTRREVRLDPALWHAVVRRARTVGVTPSVVLLACYTWVLGQWSAQRELTVTLTRFDRREVHPDVMRVVGDFSSLLLVADRPGAQESWLGRVRRLQEQLWHDLDHQQVSAIRVLRELARDSAAEPVPVVFTSMLGVDDELARSVRWPDYTQTQTPQVWLDHQVIELPDGLLLSWDSVDELFPDGLIEDMFAAYHGLVRGLGDLDWEQPLAPALPARQRAVRDRVNHTAAPVTGELLHAPMFEVAAADPDRTALVTGDTVVSFGALADHSRRIAALLAAHGVRPGDAVAVCAARGAALVAALYGVLAAGAAYVPVAVDQPVQRRTAILDQAGVAAVLTDDTRRFPAPAHPTAPARPAGAAAAEPPVLDIADARGHEPAPVHRGSGCDLAYVIFTSGSTGVPKGVEIEHRQAVNTLADLRDRYGLGASDRVLALAAADFDLSVFDLFGVLGAGGSAVIVSDEDRRDPERWLALVREHGVTVWNTVPAMLDMLLTVAETVPEPLPTLRLALVSGDWVGLDLPARLAARSANCRFIALGGATEASIWSNCFEVERVDPAWVSIPYGRPLRNQRFRVVDEQGNDRPDWVPGELLIGGAGVARGYRSRPDLTAASFFDEGGVRWYRTGDVGRYRGDGVLEFLGRVDRQVKIRGHRVELGEVEQTIAAHPTVRRAFAVAVGERSQSRLVAFVEPELPEDLPRFLSDRLPSAWIPDLIPLPAPPLTGNGKIDHAALARRVRTQSDPPDHEPGEPIRPGLESRIAQIWADTVGAAPPDRHTSFFAVGGDSLSATRLVGRLARELGITVTLRAFFAAPTIAGLGDNDPHNGIDLEEGAL
ncbi:non-ribosomal peptide synthetase [Nocardia farcinica]|nr:non-ribosomal peptide synthetase [Nocardia farcinica]